MKLRTTAFTQATHFAIALATLCVLAWPLSAAAEQWAFHGARYQAMGGTGVAFSNDGLAGYYNPANLGFEKGWDVQLPFTLTVAIENKAAEKAQGIADLVDDSLVSAFEGGADLGQTQTENGVDLLIRLGTFGQRKEAVRFGANLGLAGHVKNFGVSLISTNSGAVMPVVDLDHMAAVPLAVDGAAAVDALVANAAAGTPTNVALASTISGLTGWAGSSNPTDNANALVFAAESRGHDTTEAPTRAVLLALAEDTGDPTGANSFASNESGFLVVGLSTEELGFSYAHVIPVPLYDTLPQSTHMVLDFIHNKISAGATLKLITGITFAEFTDFDRLDDAGTLLKDVAGFKNSETTFTWGLDLAMNYRPYEWLRFGLIAKNVNSPSFDIKKAATLNAGQRARFGNEIELNPQVRMGASVAPFSNWIVSMDVDLTENDLSNLMVVGLPVAKSRILSFGTEYKLPIFSKNVAVALRAGAFNNVAGEGANWAVTGGAGLRLWSFHFDLSGGGSLEKENIDGTRIANRLVGGFTLKWEKSI